MELAKIAQISKELKVMVSNVVRTDAAIDKDCLLYTSDAADE